MYFDFEEDDEFVDGCPDDYLGYRDFYELFCKFYNKINIDSDSDSDSDTDTDSDSD